jgi:serine/threonine-protein kinase
MEALIAALERGRTRLRRRVSAAAVGLTVLLLSAGGWRLAHGSRIACAAPKDRIAGAWAPNAPADSRRESIHRAFAATGLATAETSWERLSKVLDNYLNAWRAMYVQACEATHVRGEQSADVLDLRMSCLNDNLDQVRTLTDALVTADRTAVSRVVTAALDLTPVARCADVGLLRSTIPLPHDERTLHEVQRLRRALAEIETMREIGRQPAALARALHLVPQVEATKYKPLLGELLEAIGSIQADSHLLEAEKSLEDAFVTAESAGDDITAAKAASALIYIAGGDLGRREDAQRWGRIAIALLDRVGNGQERTRAWTLNNLGAVSALNGQPEDAKNLFERALVLKEEVLGKEHPDVAISLDALGFALIDLGRPTEGLAAVDRAIAIHHKYSDPANPLLASALSNRGDGLRALRRYGEAEESFKSAIEILDAETEAAPYLARALSGLSEVKLATGQAAAAIPLLERALRIYDRYPGTGAFKAATEFALARSLWEGGRDRHRARRLAEAAREGHAALNRGDRAEVIAKWLLEHKH